MAHKHHYNAEQINIEILWQEEVEGLVHGLQGMLERTAEIYYVAAV